MKRIDLIPGYGIAIWATRTANGEQEFSLLTLFVLLLYNTAVIIMVTAFVNLFK